ncbi:DUF3846 domain-containing protein [Streptomyces laurentii]|uniref:DUF3846 domain-containing protein n=1 Tax=Streptomyces laurentii TaxID=39478 RepID=UPI0036ABBDDC
MSETASTTTCYALLVRPTGEYKLIDWPSGNHLEILRTTIGCETVDVADINKNLSMWVDDEGLLSAEPQENIPATLLCALNGVPRQIYFGSAVFTGGTGRGGETLGLTEYEALDLIEALQITLDGLRSIPAQRTK